MIGVGDASPLQTGRMGVLKGLREEVTKFKLFRDGGGD